MEQAIEQVRQQVADQATGRFLPGRSGNPHGRAAPKVRAAQEAAELARKTAEFNGRVTAESRLLVSDFVERYGRAPTAGEAARIGAAALVAVKIREPALLDPEHVVRLANGLARALQIAGLGQVPVREAAADASPSLADIAADLASRRGSPPTALAEQPSAPSSPSYVPSSIDARAPPPPREPEAISTDEGETT